MLVLSRRPSESILLTTDSGQQIVVVLDKITHGKASIGIQADSSVSIVRTELIGTPRDRTRAAKRA